MLRRCRKGRAKEVTAVSKVGVVPLQQADNPPEESSASEGKAESLKAWSVGSKTKTTQGPREIQGLRTRNRYINLIKIQ